MFAGSGGKHGAFELLQAQVVFEFARVFEQIDLRVAVRAERDADAFAEQHVGGNDAVAQIAFRCRAGTDVRLRMAELRAIRATYADSQSQDDLEKFPPARRPKPPRRGVQPRPPRSKPALLKSAALGSVRQLMPVRETSRRNPEMAVPHVFLNRVEVGQMLQLP